MDDGIVVLAHDIDTEFLGMGLSWEGKRAKKGHTTMSSDLSSYGSLSRLSVLSCSPLIKVPLEP
jgi:hypothetical protein